MQETFRLGALHIDETVAYSESEATAQQRTQAVQSTVAGIDESMPFHSVLLEDALPSDEDSEAELPTTHRRHQLQELVTASLSCLSPAVIMTCHAEVSSCHTISEADADTLGRRAQELPKPRRILVKVISWQLRLCLSAAGCGGCHRQGGHDRGAEERTACANSGQPGIQQDSQRGQRHAHCCARHCHVSQGRRLCAARMHPVL